MTFIEKNCVNVPEFLRINGNIGLLNKAEVRIEDGYFDFLRPEYCVRIIGPLFRRFLTKLKEPIIPNIEADYMNSIKGKAYAKDEI